VGEGGVPSAVGRSEGGISGAIGGKEILLLEMVFGMKRRVPNYST
jgi:hypothetical protein